MTKRALGTLCDPTRSVGDDAKVLRQMIAYAQKTGTLPSKDQMKVSVRKRRATHDWAIDVEITFAGPLFWRDPADFTGRSQRDASMRAEVRAALETIRTWHRALNWDGSDLQSDLHDVKFYGHPSLSSALGYGMAEVGRRFEIRRREDGRWIATDHRSGETVDAHSHAAAVAMLPLLAERAIARVDEAAA